MGEVNLSILAQLVSSVGAGAAIFGEASVHWPWHKSGRRGRPVQKSAGVCKIAGTDLFIGVIVKGCGLGLKGMTIFRQQPEEILNSEPLKLYLKSIYPVP